MWNGNSSHNIELWVGRATTDSSFNSGNLISCIIWIHDLIEDGDGARDGDGEGSEDEQGEEEGKGEEAEDKGDDDASEKSSSDGTEKFEMVNWSDLNSWSLPWSLADGVTCLQFSYLKRLLFTFGKANFHIWEG